MKVSLLEDTELKITEAAVKQTSTTLLPVESIILVTRSGILRKYLPVAKNTVPLAINQDLKALIPNRDIDADFALYQLIANGPRILSRCQKSGTTVESIEFSWLRAFPVAKPSNKTEQGTISAALSDVDGLIEALDRLIAKKRATKQGAMQQLLTGKTRLPGFKDRSGYKQTEVGVIPVDWQLKPLRKISSMNGRIGWQGLKQSEFTTNPDDPFLITGMNFRNDGMDWDAAYHVSKERYAVAPQIQLRCDDVLMTKDGTIGKLLYINSIPYPGSATLNSHLLVFRPIADSFVPKFLFYQLSSRRFADHVELSKSGSTFFGISQQATGKFATILPPIPEQQAIAAVLSDMDAEIAALERRRDKTKAIKQGMMQTLLTGRVRLIKPGAKA